jgi:FtsP/CotA-like multicopper oxidase with cupredoxin domain
MRQHLENEEQVRNAWSEEMRAARTAHGHADDREEWTHLERAHILSQPSALRHIRTHAGMFVAAVRRRDRHEILGQVFRLLVAGPGSITGRYPVGNTGGANVNAFKPMPIPEDLRVVLGQDANSGGVVKPMTHESSGEDPTTFSTDIEGLPEAADSCAVRLCNGDEFELRIGPVRKRIGDDVLRMLAYNESIPGPTLHVDQGSTLTVEVRNASDMEATVHWHGLRVENRYDGVPFETQAPIPAGGRYAQRLRFPDPGVYWYHPHIREDYGLELGLYGTVVVEPSDPSYWAPADRFLTLTLDDLLVEDHTIAPFLRAGPTHTAMGRFGNVMLTNGCTAFLDTARVGEVVRMYLVNTANTRVFKFGITNARMKLVGGDSGRYEQEQFVDNVLLAPSERAVIDVLFDSAGDARLEHRTPNHIYELGTISVGGTSQGAAAASFETLRADPALSAVREDLARDLERSPDRTLAFWSEMPLLYGQGTDETEITYHVCPMDSDIAASFAAICPKCGMKLLASEPDTKTPMPFVCPMHAEITASWATQCPLCGMTLKSTDAGLAVSDHDRVPHRHDGSETIEWEDDMVAINRQTNVTNMIWQLIDRDTGAKNADISWRFTVGDRVKIRLVNEPNSDHPMPHPFHVHGAGRFIVLSRNETPQTNFVWKDTVLVFAGETVDILLDVTNPGLWMAHCHIAEHNQSGMMFSFEVEPKVSGESDAQ